MKKKESENVVRLAGKFTVNGRRHIWKIKPFMAKIT